MYSIHIPRNIVVPELHTDQVEISHDVIHFLRRDISYITNHGIRSFLLKQLNNNARYLTELFCNVHPYDRKEHSIKQQSQILFLERTGIIEFSPYENSIAMAFVYAPKAVCNELTELLIQCDKKTQIALLSRTDHDGLRNSAISLIQVIMKKAPIEERRKISSILRTFTDDGKKKVLKQLHTLDTSLITSFNDSDESCESHCDCCAYDIQSVLYLISALDSMHKSTLFDFIVRQQNHFTWSDDGIVSIFQENPSFILPEPVVLALLDLCDKFDDAYLKRLFFGSSELYFAWSASPNLTHVLLNYPSQKIVRKMFSLLQRLDEKDIRQLFMRKAVLPKKLEVHDESTFETVKKSKSQTPIEILFSQEVRPSLKSQLIIELSKYPAILEDIVTDKKSLTLSPSKLITSISNAEGEDFEEQYLRAKLILENLSLRKASEWFAMSRNYTKGENGKEQSVECEIACCEQSILLDKTYVSSLHRLWQVYSDSPESIEQSYKPLKYIRKAASLGHFPSIKQFIVIYNNNLKEAHEWNILGKEHFCKNEYHHARACFEQALSIDENNLVALNYLGMILGDLSYSLSDYKKALSYFQKSESLGDVDAIKGMLLLENPGIKTAEEWYNLGNQYFFGQIKKENCELYAENCFQLALSSDSNHEASVNSIQILSRHKKEDKLTEYYEDLINTQNPQCIKLALEAIIDSDEVAGLTFSQNRNWLHLLADLPVTDMRYFNLLIQAVNKIRGLGVNIYARDSDSRTPFYNSYSNEFNYIFGIMRPSDFIGADGQIDELTTFFDSIKINPCCEQHVVLVSGPPGVGKSEITKKVAQDQGFQVLEYVRGTKDDKYNNQEEARIIDLFKNAIDSDKPVCIVLDEIDALLPDSDDLTGDFKAKSERIVTLFQTEIDKLKGKKVVVVGATNYIERIKGAVKSRAGATIAFDLPNLETRNQLVQDLLRGYKLEPGSTIIQNIVDGTSGWGPRDLKNYIDRVIGLQKPKSFETILLDMHFEVCFESIRKELERPKKGHAKIIAPKLKSSEPTERTMSLSKEVLQASENICEFIANPTSFSNINPKYKTHTILYGPPGTGKTDFARLIVERSNCQCFVIEPGMDFQAISKTFSQAKLLERAIIFIDEFDKFASLNSVTRELIQTEMDGFEKPTNILVVISATNFITNVASPVLSRFGQKINVTLPNEEQRSDFFAKSLKDLFVKAEIEFDDSLQRESEANYENLAMMTAGFSIRDLHDVINRMTPVLVKYTNLSHKGKSKEPFLNSIFDIIDAVIESEKKISKPSLSANKSSFFNPSSAVSKEVFRPNLYNTVN